VKLRHAIPALLLLSGSAAFSLTPHAAQSTLTISTEQELEADLKAVPCKEDLRLASVKSLFLKMGATEDEITTENFKGVENLIIRKQGQSDERIVIGAHYDKATNGCGAIDNWTGIVTIAHLYRTLKRLVLKKSLLFVAFGKEELGLIGSHAMVSAIPKEELDKYCAMVNIDSLGLGAPQVADNMATDKIKKLAVETASRMNMELGHSLVYGDSDSSSFAARKIPACTIHGLTNEYHSLLHTSRDTANKINPKSVYLGYRFALLMIASISNERCDAFR